MAKFLFLGVQMMWTGVLVLFSLDLWVSADELGRPTTFWWDNDIQVKNNNNQESWRHIFRKYCDSTHIKVRCYLKKKKVIKKGKNSQTSLIWSLLSRGYFSAVLKTILNQLAR